MFDFSIERFGGSICGTVIVKIEYLVAVVVKSSGNDVERMKSGLAKTALYKRTILEEEYDIVESGHENAPLSSPYYSKTIDPEKRKFPNQTKVIVKATGKRVVVCGFDPETMKYNCYSHGGFFSKSYTEDELEPE
jgi:hypothetical protein